MNRKMKSFKIGTASLIKIFNSGDFYRQIFSMMADQLAGTNSFLLYFYDNQKNVFNIEYAFGFERNICGMNSMRAMESICSGVFMSGTAELVTDRKQIESLAKNIEELAGIIHFGNGNILPALSSIVAIPIKTDNIPAGVFIALSFSPAHPFNQDDTKLMGEFIAVIELRRKFERMSIENSHLQDELALIKSTVERKSDILLYISAVSSTFSGVFLKGEGFNEMLRLAYSYTSFPMALYNVFLEQIGSTGTADYVVLPENILDSIPPHGLSQKKWLYIEQEDKYLYLLPVRYGGIMRGILSVRTPQRLLSLKERAVLETLLSYLSFVWLKMTEVNDRNKKLKNELLSNILSSKNDNVLLSQGKMFGFVKNGKFFVIMLNVPNVDNHIDYCDRQEGFELLHLLEGIIKTKTRGNIIVPEYNDICIIASCNDSNCSRKRYANVVDDVIAAIIKARPEITISGSRIYDTIFGVRKCYWEASQCLTIIHRYFTHRKSFNYINMGVLRLLLTHKREDIEAYLEDILQPVVEYDRNKGTDLIMTLFYYSRFNKAIGYVSKKLNIHPNTLYQRVKKIEALLGYSLEDPMDWFDIQAASIMYGLLYTNLITKL